MDGEKHIQKAYESILDHDFEQAISFFEQAIGLEPDNAEYHYKLSVTCSRSNQLARAVKHAELAVSLAPENETYRLHYQRLTAKMLLEEAEACFHGGEAQLYMAVALLKQAIELDALMTEAYLLLALAYSGLHDYGPALQAAKDAVRLDPGSESAVSLWKEIESKLNQYIHSDWSK